MYLNYKAIGVRGTPGLIINNNTVQLIGSRFFIYFNQSRIKPVVSYNYMVYPQ